MKRLVMLSVVLIPFLVLADEVVPTESWLLQVLTFVSTAKGLTAVALAAGFCQLAMQFFKTPLSGFAGKFKLLAVAGLTVPALVLAAVATGSDLLSAVGQAPVLAAVQVFLNEVWKHFFGEPKK